MIIIKNTKTEEIVTIFLGHSSLEQIGAGVQDTQKLIQKDCKPF